MPPPHFRRRPHPARQPSLDPRTLTHTHTSRRHLRRHPTRQTAPRRIHKICLYTMLKLFGENMLKLCSIEDVSAMQSSQDGLQKLDILQPKSKSARDWNTTNAIQPDITRLVKFMYCNRPNSHMKWTSLGSNHET